MENVQDSKIHKLLNKMLEPEFEITDVQLNLLSNYLPDLCLEQTIEEDFLTPWFKRFTDIWRTSREKISTKIILLIGKIIGIICTDEQMFLNLNVSGMINEFFQIIRSVPEVTVVPYIYNYIGILAPFLNHKSGIQWMIATNTWNDVFTIMVKKTDEVVLKEGCTFMATLINKSIDDNKIFQNNMNKKLLAPLLYLNKFISSSEEDVKKDGMCLEVTIRLNILENILKEMLVRNCVERDFRFIEIMQKNFQIEDMLEELTNKRQLKDFCLQLNRILSLVIYFILAKDLKEHNFTGSDKIAQMNHLSAKTYDILVKISYSIGYSAVLELLIADHSYFKQIVNSLIGTEIAIIDFQYQMLAFVNFPIRRVICNITGCPNMIPNELDEVKEQFITKLMRRFLPLTFKTTSQIKTQFTTEDVLTSFQCIQNIAHLYEHDVLISHAQSVIYFFSELLEYMDKCTAPMTSDIEKCLQGVVDTMIYLFTEFDLSWKDSIENIYVTNKAIDLLRLPNLSTKLVTAALQLLIISVRKNLSPKMCLLEDNLYEGLVNRSRNLINRYLDDPHWEIRNGGVQLIDVLVQTKKEYAYVRAILIEPCFPEKILNFMISDPQICVKISALRCLRHFVKGDVFWENLQKIPNFYDKIMKSFYLETDGVLRSETVDLITTLYEHHVLPDEIVEKFYDIMSYAVLEDDFWPVKINALSFWKKVIDNHLSEEGMIDGEFPNVTFSKKLKKIITFDDYEIKKSLSRVLTKLAPIGCLTAFLFAVNSDSEVIIEQTALQIIQPFVQLLKRYYCTTLCIKSPRRKSIGSLCSDRPNGANSSDSSNIFSPYSESLYNDILDMEESIISDDSILSTILEYSDSDNPEAVQRNEFLRFVENFECYIKNSTKSNDIEILLKDILS